MLSNSSTDDDFGLPFVSLSSGGDSATLPLPEPSLTVESVRGVDERLPTPSFMDRPNWYSEVVDEEKNELQPEQVTEMTSEIEYFLVSENIRLPDRAETPGVGPTLSKGEPLKVRSWRKSGVEVDSKIGVYTLRPQDFSSLQPVVSLTRRPPTEFSFAELMVVSNRYLGRIFDEPNIIDVIKDFILLDTKYFQNSHSVLGESFDGPGPQGVKPSFVKSISFKSRSIRGADFIHSVYLQENGGIRHMDQKEDEPKLTCWSLLARDNAWCLLIYNEFAVHEVLDYDEVFRRDGADDVVLPLRIRTNGSMENLDDLGLQPFDTGSLQMEDLQMYDPVMTPNEHLSMTFTE